jgi:hypothetical protein
MNAGGASITARMGMDAGDMRKELRSIEAESAASGKRMQKHMADAHKGSGSNNRAIGDALDAITGEKGWVMRMNMLQHSLPIAAFAGLAVGAEKLNEALQKSVEAAKDARAELAKPIQPVIAQGGEAVKQALADIDKVDAKLKESSEGWAGYLTELAEMLIGPEKLLGDAIIGKKFVPWGNEVNVGLRQDLAEKRASVGAEGATQAKEETEERSKALHIGKEALAIVETEKATREKIATIKNDHTLPADLSRAQQNQAGKEGAEKVLALKSAQAAGKINLATEEAITAVKKKGVDVEVKSLEARLNGEKMLAAEAAKVSEQAGAEAMVKVHATEVEYEAAQRVSAEKKEQLSIEMEVAQVQGGADARHAAALDLESAELKKRWQGAREDERAQISAAIAKNEQAKLEAATEQVRKNARLRDTQIDSHKGQGQMEEAYAVAAHLANARVEKSATDADPNASPQEKADAGKKVNDLKKQYDEVWHVIGETNQEAQENIEILDAQLAKQDQIAEALRTQFEFQKKIAQAEKDELPDTAKSLRMEQEKTLALQLQNLARQVKDASKATISELAENAHNQEGAKARQVERLEKRADKQRKQGHEDEADKIQGQADEIKKDIGPLKDGEKEGANRRDQANALAPAGDAPAGDAPGAKVGPSVKGGPQPDVGNRSVKGKGYVSGLDGFEKHMPDKTHMPDLTHMPGPTHMPNLTDQAGKTKDGAKAEGGPKHAEKTNEHLGGAVEILKSIDQKIGGVRDAR